MDPGTVRKINLIEALAEEHPGWAALPDDAAQHWTEGQIRQHYGELVTTACRIIGENSEDSSREFLQSHQAGGGCAQSVASEGCGPTPPEVRANQLAATVDKYRRQAIADGLPFRPDGLFPPGDALLAELGAQARTHAFEKHLAGRGAPAELLPRGSWASGNAAALAGLDLRLFYQERLPGKEWGLVMGAARLGEGASIGNGFWMTAHGGAVETLLDEATAELGKLEFSPMLATIEISFRIVKAVPLHTTLRVDCEIERIRGMRCWVKAAVRDTAGALLATCEAQLADLQQLWRLQA